ncbi:MAG: pentapeptide repeat-containing protein [Lachnospiraceae bacterium]|nr:pentapeptide repeat-containing protein [Lachnospiraceae bacterium]
MQGLDLQKKSKELAIRLDNYVKSHFEHLVSKFTDCFLDYCDKIYQMQQQGEKGAIAYIHFSVLRTNILLRKHEIRLDAYDENWYMDVVECSSSYQVGEFYSYFEEYEDLIEELRSKSMGKVSLAEAQKRVFAESNLYLLYIAELIRAGMRDVIRTEAYQRVDRASCFVVCIGGFMDRFDILYKEDHTLKDSKEVKRCLQSKKRTLFSYEICENLDLSEGNYEELEFQYSSFAGCDFTGSSWNNSRILFSSFKNTILKDTKMEKMKIFDTDFSGATLEHISFAGAKLKHISFVGATLSQVDFSGALLAEEINFKDALIVNCKLPERR